MPPLGVQFNFIPKNVQRDIKCNLLNKNIVYNLLKNINRLLIIHYENIFTIYHYFITNLKISFLFEMF